MQKRPMIFTPGLENEDSFMIIPNEFVKDHALTQEEIEALMTPDPEYERAYMAKHRQQRRGILGRIRNFLTKSTPDKIITIKMRWNKLIGRKLHSRYTQSHAEDFL